MARRPAVTEAYRLADTPHRIALVLSNGMGVIALRHDAAPVASVRAYIRAGSALEGERAGSGMTHLLEHVVTGGATRRRDEAGIMAFGDAIGGLNNAYTAVDHMCYHTTVQRGHLAEALELISDWVVRPTLSRQVFEREMGVVRREWESDRDDPQTMLDELLYEVVYRQHPMGCPVIGRAGAFAAGGGAIAAVTFKELLAYHRRTHVPAGCVVVVAGDIDPQETVHAVVRAFRGFGGEGDAALENGTRKPDSNALMSSAGGFPAAPVVLLPEPMPIHAPIRAIRAMKTDSTSMAIAWLTVREASPDDVPLDVLSSVLTEGDSARLVRELRWGGRNRGAEPGDQGRGGESAKQLVFDISGTHESMWHSPGTLRCVAQLDGDDLAAVEARILAAVELLRREHVSEAELERARRQNIVAVEAGRQTAEALAAQVGLDFLATGSVEYSDVYLAALRAVTAEDLRRVANQYLLPNARVTVAVVPKKRTRARPRGKTGVADGGMRSPELDAANAPLSAAVHSEAAQPPGEELTSGKLEHGALRVVIPASHASRPAPCRFVLDNGLRCIVRPMPGQAFVAASAAFPGGLRAENDSSNGVFNLLAELLPRGTITRGPEVISSAFESRGSDLRSGSGLDAIGLEFSALTEDFEPLMEVMADVIARPALAADQLELVRPAILDDIARIDEDWHGELGRLARRCMFGQSPYRMIGLGTHASVSGISVADLRRAYESSFHGGGVVTIAGDVDPERVIKLVTRLLSTLPVAGVERDSGDAEVAAASGSRSALLIPPSELARGPGPTPALADRLFVRPLVDDRHTAAIFVGYPGCSVIDREARAPLAIFGTMLCGYALSGGRLFAALRGGDHQMVYEVSGAHLSGMLPGYFGVTAACQPDRVGDVYRIIRREIGELLDGRAGDEELDRARAMVLMAELELLQTSGDFARRDGFDELAGLGIGDGEAFLSEVRSVSREAIFDTASRFLTAATIIVLTPEPGNWGMGIEPVGLES